MLRVCLIMAVMVSACSAKDGAQLSPEEEARRIYDLTRAEEVMRLSLVEMDTLMVANAQKAARDQGRELNDEAAQYFVDLIMSEAAAMMFDDIKSETIRLYVETYSPESLRAYRIFLESSEGSQIAEKQSELTQQLFEVGKVAGERAGVVAGQKVAKNISNDIWPVEGSEAAKAALRAWFGASQESSTP